MVQEETYRQLEEFSASMSYPGLLTRVRLAGRMITDVQRQHVLRLPACVMQNAWLCRGGRQRALHLQSTTAQPRAQCADLQHMVAMHSPGLSLNGSTTKHAADRLPPLPRSTSSTA
jgi:hypothetical protein